jgi:hypothetical protein
MRKSWIALQGLIILILISFVSASVIINEVELNPNDECNDCTEWIELYSDNEINLSGWEIKDASNNTFSLNFSFQGYYIIDNLSISLNNANEKLFLYNNSRLIFETPLFSDSSNDNKTWQYCNGNWKFNYMTKNYENNCTVNENTNSSQNNSEEDNDSKVSIEIEFDEDDIINGKEFNIKVKAENLKSQTYNFKVWIEDEDEGDVLTDRYGEDNEGDKRWMSGTYWIYGFFEGPGDIDKKVKLRIRDDYEKFYGDAKLFFKIEGGEEDYENIEVLKKQDNNPSQVINETKINKNIEKESISGRVIELSSEVSKIKNKNMVVYESSNEKIKQYGFIGFGVLCLGLFVLVVFNKIR